MSHGFTPPKPLRKGFAQCDVCGSVVREHRKSYHPSTPECIIRAASHRMAAAKCTRAGSLAPALKRAGIEVLRAPVSFQLVRPSEADRVPKGATPGSYRDAGGKTVSFFLWDGYWVGERVMRAVQALKGQNVKPDRRWDLVRRMAAEDGDELYQAVETARIAGGRIPKEW